MSNLDTACGLMGIAPREAEKLGIRLRGDNRIDSIGNYKFTYSHGRRIAGIGDRTVEYTVGRVSRIGDVELSYFPWDGTTSLKSRRSLREYFFPGLAYRVL